MIEIDKLRAALRRRGLHQFELAEQLGESETLVSRIFCGRIEPDQKMKAKIARVLRVSVSELFPEDGATRGKS